MNQTPTSIRPCAEWLPPGKTAALCFTIDDIHPGKSTDPYYEAGGDLDNGVLGRLRWLLDRHAELHTTLFVPADWIEISPFASRRIVPRIPIVRKYTYWSSVRPKGSMRLDRHPQFVNHLKSMPRVDVGLHGLYHFQRGPSMLREFENRSETQCTQILEKAKSVFNKANLPFVPGMCPPAWVAPPELQRAMHRVGLTFLASARDVKTPVSPTATTNMTGLSGMSLIFPQMVQGGNLVHFTSNFAPNNPIDRAFSVLDLGGLLCIKAHAIKSLFGYHAMDGLDQSYCNYLDLVLKAIQDRYGERVWWTTMNDVAKRIRTTRPS